MHGGARGVGSEELHTKSGVKSLSKPRRGGGRPHYVNLRAMLIVDDGYVCTEYVFLTRVCEANKVRNLFARGRVGRNVRLPSGWWRGAAKAARGGGASARTKV